MSKGYLSLINFKKKWLISQFLFNVPINNFSGFSGKSKMSACWEAAEW